MRYLVMVGVISIIISGCASWNEATRVDNKMTIGFSISKAEWPDGYKIERRKLVEFPPIKYES